MGFHLLAFVISNLLNCVKAFCTIVFVRPSSGNLKAFVVRS